MICQCSLNCNKYATQVRRCCRWAMLACIGAVGQWELSVLLTQFFCEPKATKKIVH